MKALLARLGTLALPLSRLRRGGARPRALLFKALADCVGLPCGITVGSCVRGAHAHHAWATVRDGDEVLVVDLVHSPGELYEEGSDAARRYQRVDEFSFSSLGMPAEVSG